MSDVDDYLRDREDGDGIHYPEDELREEGCLFPGKCCMPADHLKSECHTAEMMEAMEATERQHDWSGNWNELSYCIRCMSFEGATTTECPGKKMSNAVSDAVYKGKIDFRHGEWCNQPAFGMSHIYGTTREPYEKVDLRIYDEPRVNL